jgi:hypothetical protein
MGKAQLKMPKMIFLVHIAMIFNLGGGGGIDPPVDSIVIS